MAHALSSRSLPPVLTWLRISASPLWQQTAFPSTWACWTGRSLCVHYEWLLGPLQVAHLFGKMVSASRVLEYKV